MNRYQTRYAANTVLQSFFDKYNDIDMVINDNIYE